jgi:TonB family protein
MLRPTCSLILLICFYAFAQQDSGSAGKARPDSTIKPGTSQESAGIKDSLPPVDTMPRVMRFVKANYPDSLIEKGIAGQVEFDLLVSEKGSVDSAAIVKGLHTVLDSSALTAVRSFTFAPAMAAGKPVAVLLRYAYTFSIDEASVPGDETVNLFGTITEKGSRQKVSRAIVAISFEDTIPPKKKNRKIVLINTKQDNVPLSEYLRRIGKIKGHKFEEGRIITTTDSLGRFSFSSLPCGTIRIRILASGYKPLRTTACIKKGVSVRQSLWLERDSYNDNEIVVYGRGEDEEIQTYEVSAKELRRVPGFNGEAVKLLQALPGVSRPVFGGNEIIVRGADNSDSKFYLDGIEIPFLYHELSMDFLFYRGILNTDALQSVSLYPGGWGVGYGNAIGGIIDMRTRPAQKDRWHGSIDLNLKGLNLLFESPLGKNASIIGSFRGNFLFDEVGFIKRHLMGEKEESFQDYWDYSLRFDWRIAPSHHLTVTAIGANDTMYQFNPRWEKASKHDPLLESQSFGKGLTMGIAAWDWTVSPQLSNILTYGIRPTSYETFDNSWSEYMFYSASKTTRHDVHDGLTYKVNEGLNVTAGLDMRFEPFTSTTRVYWQDTMYSYSSRITFGPLSGYLSCEWKPIDKLTLTPGLRYDYYPQLSYHGSWLPEFWNYRDKVVNNHTRFSGDPSLRISGRYELDAKHAITASAGNYNESPDSIIMMTRQRDGLVSEKAGQYSLGYEWKMSDIVSLDCKGYFGTQWDKPRWKSTEEIVENSSTYLADDGKGRMEGLELLLRHSQDSRFFGWLGYSLSYSQRYDYGEHKWVEYDYNSLNNLQLVANWFFKGNRSFGLRFQYTDGYPYTPYTVQYYNATYFRYIAEAGATNSKRHTPYFGLDLRYEKKFVYKRSILTAYIEGERLLHLLQYVKYKNGNPVYHPGEYNFYNYDYSAFETETIWPMATLGLTWEF